MLHLGGKSDLSADLSGLFFRTSALSNLVEWVVSTFFMASLCSILLVLRQHPPFVAVERNDLCRSG